MPEKRLLILGVTPPPIGGVSIHVKRLLTCLEKQGMAYEFVHIRDNSLFCIIKRLLRNRIVHLHTSNSYFRFLIVILARLFGKAVIFTFHGNLGRYNALRNQLDKLSVRLANVPVMINKESYLRAGKLNRKSRLIPAFIRPSGTAKLPDAILSAINNLSSNYNYIFATNAFGLEYDKTGREIYQITMLLNIFKDLNDRALVFSDPSGSYTSHLSGTGFNAGRNILIISGEHDFYEVLKLSDVFLRITTTDGDSLSLKEALYLNKAAIATDVVSRPESTILTSLDEKAVRESILAYSARHYSTNVVVQDGSGDILDLYRQLIDQEG